MNALIDSLFDRYGAVDEDGNHNAFYNDIPEKLFFDEAPNGTELPYCVMRIVSAVPDRTFTEEYRDVLIQFSLFSASGSVEEIADTYAHLKALFDEQPLTITGETLVWMREVNLVTNIGDFEITGVRHWAVDYNVLTSIN